MKKVLFVLLATVFVISGCKFGSHFDPLGGAKVTAGDEIQKVMTPNVTASKDVTCAFDCRDAGAIFASHINLLEVALTGTTPTSPLTEVVSRTVKSTTLTTAATTTSVNSLSAFVYMLLSTQVVIPRVCGCPDYSKDQMSAYAKVLSDFARQAGLTCNYGKDDTTNVAMTAQKVFETFKTKTSITVQDEIIIPLSIQLANSVCLKEELNVCTYDNTIQINTANVVAMDCAPVYKEVEILIANMKSGAIKFDQAFPALYDQYQGDYCSCGDKLSDPAFFKAYFSKFVFNEDTTRLNEYCAKVKETGDDSIMFELVDGYDLKGRYGIDVSAYETSFFYNMFCMNVLCDATVTNTATSVGLKR